MPKSKRSKLITLSQTTKKTREDREKVGSEVQAYLDVRRYVYVLRAAHMRNLFLQEVRRAWGTSEEKTEAKAENEDNEEEEGASSGNSDVKKMYASRLLFGRTRVLAKALGRTESEAYLPNIEQLAGEGGYLNGDVGLLITNETPSVVQEYFDAFVRSDYARAGDVSPIDFVVPAGIVYSTGGRVAAEDDVPMAHSLETTLRGLGMPTRLKGGKIEIEQPFVVCSKGDTLNAKQTRLLKQFGVPVAEFKLEVLAYYDKEMEQVVKV